MITHWPFLLCLAAIGCNLHEPVGVTLTYAVVDDNGPPKKIDMQKVLKAVQRRVGRYGSAETVDKQVTIGVYGSDRKNIERVQDLIARAGVLEFRVLADRRFDGATIDLATNDEFAEKHDVREKSNDEFPIAQWCPLAEDDADRLATVKQLAIRKTNAGRSEILVIIDQYHVTGDDFSQVYPSTDQTSRPCVYFTLSDDGAKRMRRLTLENLPPADDPAKQRLIGIILDGEVQSAPAIRSVIESRGQISGNFSEQEVNEICLVLSAGSLPVHLKLVDTAVVGGD